MSDPWMIAAAVACGYLAGSMPFGLVITRLAGLGDIRAIGSGNIGATNVMRTGRGDLALATLLLDGLKAGLIALAFTQLSHRETGFVAGAAAVVGHCYPAWLCFRGGKGIATQAGLLAFTSPPGLITAFSVWLVVMALTRLSSLSALAAASLVTPGAWLLGERSGTVLTGMLLLGLLTFWTHRTNIARLTAGLEPRVGDATVRPDG